MPREELYLQDIVNSIEDVGRFLSGIEETDFLGNEILQNAVLMKLIIILMKLIIIGEAAARISDETRKRHSEIEWKAIIGFRNIAVHAYFSVKWSIVWKTATADLEILHKQIAKILRVNYPDFQIRS